MREERLLEQIRRGNLFGYVQSDIEVPEGLKKNFANFPLIFINTNVGRYDIGFLMKDYAEKEWLLCQLQKNVDFKLFHWKTNSHYSSAPTLFRLGTSMQTNLSLRGTYSS